MHQLTPIGLEIFTSSNNFPYMLLVLHVCSINQEKLYVTGDKQRLPFQTTRRF